MRAKILKTTIWLLLLFSLVQPPGLSGAAPVQQGSFPSSAASNLLQELSPEERVGQLFLVTFNGTDVSVESEIYDLIVNYHVGGVVLEPDNDNFIGPESTISALQELTRALQRTEWESAQAVEGDPLTDDTSEPTYVPLFIGAAQEGNGFPNDALLTGFTPLPSLMAIGATWDPLLSREVGKVAGSELSAVGINLLLGPSLDVLESPFPESPGDLGIRTFGGDPFWVGELGQAYIQGVHEGSLGRIALVGKHFPGHGGSDRLPEEEVATVRKSLEQLKQIELAPFFTVTGDAPDSRSRVDALLTSHIRYQGFQGNIRATTNPISFDPQAFERIISLQPFVTWRNSGGLVISDDLGSRAVRRFYDPDGETYNGRIVALNAFLTGSDVLFLGNVASANDPTNAIAIRRTLEFFAQKYREDTAFAERVDRSVLRVLDTKLKLYPQFNYALVSPQPAELQDIGTRSEITFEVARNAATLISPPASELDIVIPEPPALFDRIVFFTDARTAAQCSNCPPQDVLGVDALREAVLRLYGPETGERILPFNMVSFSFEALTSVLNNPSPDSILEQTLRSADWVVFVLLDINEDRSASFALRRILAERPNLLRNKQVIVFALDAPYFLDATEITKLTAYYGLYSKTAEFIDVAARLLFKELRPIPGALPVSVPGVGYDLLANTSPDPDQVIPLVLEDTAQPEGQTATPDPQATPGFQIGDLIAVRTGVIVDHNGNPVPDNTEVQFILRVGGQLRSPQVETTLDGVAATTFVVESAGALQILARSGDPPAESLPLQFDIPTENGGTPSTESTPQPSPESTLEPSPSPSPTPTQTPEAGALLHTNPDFGDWILAAIATGLVGLAAYGAGEFSGQMRWGLRWAFCALIGGLAVYTGLTLDFPGASQVMVSGGRWGVLLLSAGGALGGWVLGLIWRSADGRDRP